MCIKYVILIGCSVVTSTAYTQSTKRIPQPGYQCQIEKRGTFGVIKSDFQIFDSGQINGAYIRWDAGNGQFANPWITGAWFKNKNGHFSIENGYISIMRHIWDIKPSRRPRPMRLSLELTSNLQTAYGTARIASKIERSGGPFHLQVNWNDASALARGPDALYVAARNSRKELVDYIEIDRAAFSRAEPEIKATFGEVEKMLASPAEKCARSEDLGTDDIIVT